MFTEIMQKVYQQACLEAYAKGYKDALTNADNSFQPGAYDNKLYIQHYRDGFAKGMIDKNDIEARTQELERLDSLK